MPTFKKFRGQIFGTQFTKKEEQAIDAAISEMIVEKFITFEKELDASMLMMLHEHFGFGYDRMMKAWRLTFDCNRQLQKRYEMDAKDSAWLCQKLLKEQFGIDLDELYEKEVRSNEVPSNSK